MFMDVDAALAEVPVNVAPLTDDTDFKTRETSVAYNAAGMDLVWNFVTTAGAFVQTAVTPTTAGDYDWTHQGDGMYTIEIPASGGASINNDTEGTGWFTGFATGVLPWVGPRITFRAAGLNDALIDNAYSATRGLAGSALPDAASDAAGGLVVSDAGGLDIDTVASNVADVLTDTETTIPDQISELNNFDPAADTVANVTTVATCTTNTDMRGTDSAFLAANAPANFPDLAITATTGLVSVGTNNDKTGYTITGTVSADIVSVSGDSTAADNLESAYDGTGYDIGGIDVSVLNTAAAAIGSDGTGLTEAGGTGDQLTALATASSLSDMAGATFNTATDSLEAIRDRGDAAWTTGAGGSAPTVEEIRTEMDDNSTKLASILTDTGTTLPDQISGLNNFDPANDTVVNVTTVAQMAGTIQTLDALDTAQDTQHAQTQTDISSLNDLSEAQINAQVLDVLNTDTFAELSSIPGAAATITQMLRLIYAMARNKTTQTATTHTLRNDADSADIGTRTVSDDGTTFTKGEIS